MIDMNDSLMTSIVKLSAGNPGAVTVLCRLLKEYPDGDGFMAILHADDMGMVGPAIWIGYKDFAGEDLETFKQALFDRSQKMIDVIRAAGYRAEKHGCS